MRTAAFIFSLLISLSCRGASYYIDFAGGSDSANGLTTATAFKHCPGDPNATGNSLSTSLAPGDMVNFKGGVIYPGSISPGQSGSALNPIIYTTGQGWGTGKALIDEQGANAVCFLISSVNFITIHNLSFTGANGNVLSGCITLNGASSVTISNCSINIYFGSGQTNDRRGIAAANVCHSLSIVNNTITTDGGSYAPGETDGMLIGSRGTNVVISGNQIYLVNSTSDPTGHNDCIQTLNLYSPVVQGNICFKDTAGVAGGGGQGMYLEWYNVSDDTTPTDFGTATIRNNLVYGYGESYLVQTMARNEPYTSNAVVRILFENNTVDAFDYSTSYPYRAAYGGTFSGGALTNRNNIFIHRRSAGGNYYGLVVDPPYAANMVIDYNHYYIPTASAGDNVVVYAGTGYTWAAWQATGRDSNSVGYSWKNPLFYNTASHDYRLTAPSPDVGAGVNLHSEFSSDIAGTSRPSVGGWSIGAYEFIAPSPSHLSIIGTIRTGKASL